MLPPIYKQIYAATDVICLFYVNNFLVAMISVMTPSLRHPESGILLTTDIESWIASLPFLLMLPAQCAGAFVAERLGRRRVVSFSLLPPAVACVLMATAHAPPALLAASAIIGLVGGGTGIGPILIAETTSPKHRGVLLTTKIFAIIMGFFTSHFLGKFLDWRRLVLFGLAPCLLGFITSLTSPESPAWLASRGRFRDCTLVFKWLRGEEDDAELEALVHAQRQKQREANLQATRGSLRCTMRYLTNKCFLKATFISVAAILIIETIGIFIVYLIDVLTDITGDKEIVHYLAAGMDVQSFVCLIISGWLIKRFQRRSLLFGSGVPATCFLLLFCLTSFLMARGVIPQGFMWLKLSCLWLYYLLRGLGFDAVTHNILGEVFPLSHRGLGVALVGFIYTFFTFAGAKILPSLLAWYGIHGTYLLLAVVLILGLTYLYFYLPETSDKTLLDIELEMGGKKLETSSVVVSGNEPEAKDKLSLIL